MARGLSKADALNVINQAGVKIGAVIDIGIREGTPELMKAYPNVPHILVEPVEEHFQQIHTAYAHIEHKLLPFAASDVDGAGTLHTMKHPGSETITHSWLVSDGQGRPMQTARIDTMVPETGIKGPYLLKIDVEGADIPAKIIEGAAGIMPQTNVIISEMVLSRFTDLANRIERFGFVLFDIVEGCYYDDVLWSSDAIFVRRDLINAMPRLRPMNNATFDTKKWWASHTAVRL
jgi:FkbM family methyltransferase